MENEYITGNQTVDGNEGNSFPWTSLIGALGNIGSSAVDRAPKTTIVNNEIPKKSVIPYVVGVVMLVVVVVAVVVLRKK